MFKSFESVDKSSWIEKVQSDLKDKAIDSLDFKQFGNNVSPFYHEEDIQHPVRLYPHTTPKLAFRHKVEDEERANTLLEEELKGGCAVLILDFEENDTPDFERLFQGIYLDMIQVLCRDLSVGGIDALHRYVTESYDPEASINILVFASHGFSKHPLVRMEEYQLTQSGDIEDQLCAFLQSGSDYVQKSADQPIFSVHATLGHKYYQNIILLRAIRLLWYNLITALEKEYGDNPLIISAVFDTRGLDENQYMNMIALTQTASSSIVGGADYLVILPSDHLNKPTGDKFSRRISRNVFHLLDQESHLTKVSDPAAGSYFFDLHTDQLSRRVWKLFINEQENG